MFIIKQASTDALRLHQAARHAFAARPTDELAESLNVLSKGSSAAWQRFLASDGCAIQLLDLLTTRLCLAALPFEARQVLRRQAQRELMDVLKVRSQIRALAAIGLAGGWPTVILKGGLAAAVGASSFQLIDIDVLIPPVNARALADELDRSGYQPVGFSSARHLMTRVAKNRLPIEIHTCLDRGGSQVPVDVWARIRPLPGIPGAFGLAAVDHIWHLLVHVVTDHPGRCVRLRDLLLISEELKECDQCDIAEINRRIAVSADRATFLVTLRYAMNVGSGLSCPDPYPAVALAHCHLHPHARPGWMPALLYSQVRQWVIALLVSKEARRNIWRDVRRFSLDRSPAPWIARTERVSPTTGRALRMATRLIVRVAARVIAAPAALQVRRAASRASVGRLAARTE